MDELRNELMAKVKVLNETVWEHKLRESDIERWLANFALEEQGTNEQLHALHLLSQFMYFGARELRELLVSLYRDLYRYPIIASIRQKHGHTTDVQFLNREFESQLRTTRFRGLGNPSESGAHLLYYFRQENGLRAAQFRTSADSNVTRYVFIDDLCGSGTQAERYAKRILPELRKKSPHCKLFYFVLFAFSDALRYVRANTDFDSVEAVYALDDSFHCFGDRSRYYIAEEEYFSREFARQMAEGHGRQLWPEHPLGYNDGQLLLGFTHNIPNNTLPIVWKGERRDGRWSPIFPRYSKV